MNIAMTLRARQAGATLIVGLILLLVLTVVGVSGMNTATMEVAMSGANQYQQDAFQMAEQGIDLAIGRRGFRTDQIVPINWLGDPNYDRRSVTSFVTAAPVIGTAFSTGEGGGNLPKACHFSIVSVGTAARNSVATHTQNFFIVGPCG